VRQGGPVANHFERWGFRLVFYNLYSNIRASFPNNRPCIVSSSKCHLEFFLLRIFILYIETKHLLRELPARLQLKQVFPQVPRHTFAGTLEHAVRGWWTLPMLYQHRHHWMKDPALGGCRHARIAREVGLAGMSVPKVGPPMAEAQGSAPGMLKGSRMPRPGFR
jgi:hypothetical protein